MYSRFISQSQLQSESKYQFADKPFAKGRYGKVYNGSMWVTYQDKKIKIAIVKKEMSDPAGDAADATQLLREISILNMLKGHKNIISLQDIIMIMGKINLIFNRFDTDLRKIIISVMQKRQTLSIDHIRYFVYQILSAVWYIHSAQVVHRDLKPENIFINYSDCRIKIGDFGLARLVPTQEVKEPSSFTMDGAPILPRQFTEYRVTRWYRSPELLLRYLKGGDKPSDMWSVGCILAELLQEKPLFPGRDEKETLDFIFNLKGTPNQQDREWIDDSVSSELLIECSSNKPDNFQAHFAKKDPSAVDLIQQMLILNPVNRYTAGQALEHNFFNSDKEKPPLIPFSMEKRSKVSQDSAADYKRFEDNLDCYPSRKLLPETAHEACELIQKQVVQYFNTSSNFFGSAKADSRVNNAIAQNTAEQSTQVAETVENALDADHSQKNTQAPGSTYQA